MKNFLFKKVSLWIFLLIIISLIAATTSLMIFFRQSIYNYSLVAPNSENIIPQLQYGSQPMLANANYFHKVLDSLIEQKASFLLVDLDKMRLEAYIGGRLVKTVPILAKGKKGSWWETPTGIYKVESKERQHFSSFSGVYFNWAIAFEGNFFIHGWPYYRNGEKVSSAYSGGCIRLADSDAKEIYEITMVGEPVLVFENELEKDDFTYQQKIPGITAKSYLAADLKNNFVFFEKFSKELAVAPSASKLLSSLVMLAHINLDKSLMIKSNSFSGAEKSRLTVDQKVSFYDLLHLFLLESSSEAAEIITNEIGKDRLIKLINEKAKAVGMQNFSFEDALGLEDKNLASAQDLFILSKYIYYNKSFIYKLTSQKLNYSLYRPPIFSDLVNVNKIEIPEFFGGSWGRSQSGKQAMIAVFEVKKEETVRPISIVVLESEDAKKDIEIIFNYIKNIYF